MWSEDFTRKLEVDEYPSMRLNHTRENFDAYRVGLVQTGKKIVMDCQGECLYDPANPDIFIGGVVWLRELGELEDVRQRELEHHLRDFTTICESLPHIVWTSDNEVNVSYLSSNVSVLRFVYALLNTKIGAVV